MRLITILTDPAGYSDRLASIDAVGTYVDQNVVLCKATDDDLRERFSRTTFISPKTTLNSWKYFLWAARTAKEQSRDNEEDWCIVEIATSITLCLLRIRWRSKSILVQQLVTPAYTFMRNQGWADDSYAPRLGMLQWLRWFMISARQCLLLSLATRVCNGFIGNSAQSADEIRDRRVSVGIVPNCVTSPGRCRDQAEQKADAFLVASAIQPSKGFGIVLEAFRLVRKAGASCRLVIAGRLAKRDADWFRRLRQEYSDVWADVVVLGVIDRKSLNELYATSRSLVLASLYEGSPRVVYESLANGCPVIASDIPGIREIAPDKPWVSLFGAGDPTRCADEMLKSLDRVHPSDDPDTDRMIKFVTEQYSPELRARRLHESILEIATCNAKDRHDNQIDTTRSNRVEINR